MPSVTITWRSVHDDHVCPICKAIDGYTWEFKTGEGGVPYDLVHPTQGIVWNRGTGSDAHGHKDQSCRCHLEIGWKLADLIPKAQALLDAVESTQESQDYIAAVDKEYGTTNGE